jgi:hypothetical protein
MTTHQIKYKYKYILIVSIFLYVVNRILQIPDTGKSGITEVKEEEEL